MTNISGFENFEIVKMGQKGSFWRKPVWVKNAFKFCCGVIFYFQFFMS